MIRMNSEIRDQNSDVGPLFPLLPSVKIFLLRDPGCGVVAGIGLPRRSCAKAGDPGRDKLPSAAKPRRSHATNMRLPIFTRRCRIWRAELCDA